MLRFYSICKVGMPLHGHDGRKAATMIASRERERRGEGCGEAIFCSSKTLYRPTHTARRKTRTKYYTTTATSRKTKQRRQRYYHQHSTTNDEDHRSTLTTVHPTFPEANNLFF